MIVSGGQTGADRAGWDAAIELGLPYGGWVPKARRAEDGRIPDRYTCKETSSSDYPFRTRLNVQESDGTVVFARGEPERGSALTQNLAFRLRKPCIAFDIDGDGLGIVEQLREWIERNGIHVLNVAGNRESKSPGIGERVRRILVEALREG